MFRCPDASPDPVTSISDPPSDIHFTSPSYLPEKGIPARGGLLAEKQLLGDTIIHHRVFPSASRDYCFGAAGGEKAAQRGEVTLACTVGRGYG